MKFSDFARLVARLSAAQMLLFAAVHATLLGPFLRAGGVPNFQNLTAPFAMDYAAALLRIVLDLLGAALLFGKTDRIVLFLAGRPSAASEPNQPTGKIDDMTSRGLAIFLVRMTSAWLFLSGLIDATYLGAYHRAYRTVFWAEPAHLAVTENYYAALIRVALYFGGAVILFQNAERTISLLIGQKGQAKGV